MIVAEGEQAECATFQLYSTPGTTCKELTQEKTRKEQLRMIDCREGVERIDKGLCRPPEKNRGCHEQTQEGENVIRAISQRDGIAESNWTQTELVTLSETNSFCLSHSLYSPIESAHLASATVGEKDSDSGLNTTNVASAIEKQVSEEEAEDRLSSDSAVSIWSRSELDTYEDFYSNSDSPLDSPAGTVGSADDTMVRHNNTRLNSNSTLSTLSESESDSEDFSSGSESDYDVASDKSFSSESELANPHQTPSSDFSQGKAGKASLPGNHVLNSSSSKYMTNYRRLDFLC